MIAENLADVQTRIARAAGRAGRNPAGITLVGVTKTRPVAAMLAAYRAGLRHFGENRVEEMAAKTPEFLAAVNPADLPVMHMIGHLQSRKAAAALQHAQLIHSVDTLKLAQRLNRLVGELGRPPAQILLECNISGEASKAGFNLAGWQKDEQVRQAFRQNVAAMATLSHIQIMGLMTMAPVVAEAEQARPIFSSLRQLLAVCAADFPQIQWRHLSMGMTGDFEIAVEEGATLVRVGRAIFGEQP